MKRTYKRAQGLTTCPKCRGRGEVGGIAYDPRTGADMDWDGPCDCRAGGLREARDLRRRLARARADQASADTWRQRNGQDEERLTLRNIEAAREHWPFLVTEGRL